MLEKLQEEGSFGGTSKNILRQGQTAVLSILQFSYIQEI